ncbi:MAG TPA: hypothetical protein VNI01_08050 [Elusimicrobiota bacterium]|nr:hypothetical protein [Elusimicrobiota bacterium]
MGPSGKLALHLKSDQRLALLGRLRMAEWIEMPEREFAREIKDIESDPLFQKLLAGPSPEARAVRRQRWPGSRLSGSFYDVNEAVTAGGERVRVEEKLEERGELLPLIQKMGAPAFERYFIHGEDGLGLDELARRTGVSAEDAQRIRDLILDIGVEAEFAGPMPEPGPSRPTSCLARVAVENDVPVFEFYSPHWARGMYQIRYDTVEQWKRQGRFDGMERRRLRHLLKRLEIVNLRQNTLFRILESLTKLQAEFLTTRREDRKRPISLRMLARRLSLAPSTVSRALAGRSVRLPWGPELPLIRLVPGRRNVLREVMGRWLAEGGDSTDRAFADRLRKDYGIAVSRRTVNAVRNELRKKPAP